MKKRGLIFLVLVLAFSLILGACGGKDKTRGKSGKEIIVASNQAVQAVNTAAVNIETNISLPSLYDSVVVDVWITGYGLVSMEPQKGHMTFETDFPDLDGSSELYTLIEDNKLMQYFNSADDPQVWFKLEIPDERRMEAILTPVAALKIIEQSLVDAKVAGKEETEDKVKLSVLEMTLKPEALLKFMKMSSDSSSVALDQILEEKANQGEIKYKMWVRQDNLLPTKIEIDFGDVLKKLLDGEPSLLEQIKPLLEYIKGTIVITFADYDKSVNITLPATVKQNAEFALESTLGIEPEDLEELNTSSDILEDTYEE